MDTLPLVIAVFSLGSGELAVLFRGGEARRFDVTPHMEAPVFQPLKSPEQFDAVSIVDEGMGIGWPCGADLSALHLWNVGEPMKGTVLKAVAA